MIIQKQNGETTSNCAGLPHCHWDHCSLVSPLVTVQITESFARTRHQSSRQKCECVSAQVRASTVQHSTAQYRAQYSRESWGEKTMGPAAQLSYRWQQCTIRHGLLPTEQQVAVTLWGRGDMWAPWYRIEWMSSQVQRLTHLLTFSKYSFNIPSLSLWSSDLNSCFNSFGLPLHFNVSIFGHQGLLHFDFSMNWFYIFWVAL